MHKTLIVMRHAKSSWDSPKGDFDRPLNARGRDAASKLGDWLRSQSLHPDEILCSSAARTLETATRLNLSVPITPIKALYLAPADVLLNHIQKAKGNCTLLIAHNPGIADFADRLAHTPPNHPRFHDYPTGATTVFDCTLDSWSELAFSRADIASFITPKDLV